MKENVINKCKLLTENKAALNKVFFGQFEIMNIAAACSLACHDKAVDKEMVKRTNAVLKDNTGSLSILRGFVKVPLVSSMLTSADPESYLNKVKLANDAIGKNKVFKNDYLALAADILAGNKEPYEFEQYAAKAFEIYNCMKDEHPFLTSKEDYPFAMLLAIRDFDSAKVMKDAEECFEILKPEVFSRNVLQTISHVLALSEKHASEKCDRFLKLRKMLKDNGHRFGNDMELAVLAAMTLLDADDNELVDDIIEADNYLKSCKGFGNFSLGRFKRRMFAAQMTLSADSAAVNAADAAINGAAITSSISTTVAIEVCMLLIMSSAAASASASSAS